MLLVLFLESLAYSCYTDQLIFADASSEPNYVSKQSLKYAVENVMNNESVLDASVPDAKKTEEHCSSQFFHLSFAWTLWPKHRNWKQHVF